MNIPTVYDIEHLGFPGGDEFVTSLGFEDAHTTHGSKTQKLPGWCGEGGKATRW